MASALRQLALRTLRGVLPRRVFRTSERRASVATLFLTFDDGPDPETTPNILDTLARHEAKATFFVVGRQAAQHPEIVRRIAREGHTIGGHSFFHRHPTETSSEQLWQEILQTDETLREIVGQAPKLFRPPHGKLTARKLWRLSTSGRSIVLWNRDPKDFAATRREEIMDWFARNACQDGDIVLLHDTSRPTAEALEVLLDRFRRAGLSLRGLAG